MDFGFVSLESLVSGQTKSESPSKARSGSGSLKLEGDEEDDNGGFGAWRASKLARTAAKETMESMRSQEQMLSFSSTVPRYAGYGLNLNQTAMQFQRGGFTDSQWLELKHQALIYKYIASNVSVPSNLLSPLKKSLINPYPFGFAAVSSFSPAAMSSYGWGFSGGENCDPEPGRCRRTDGKKWRCSRDAVVDQKYCERHINRGRHRSRKPVEPKSTNNNNANPPSASDRRGLSISTAVSPAPAPPATMTSSSNNVPAFMAPKQETPTAPTTQSVFGFVSTDSLLNPFLDFGGQEPHPQNQNQNPLRHFIDDWPTKAEEDSVKPEWTRLSMSSRPVPVSSLRLSHECDYKPTSLVLGSTMGGPLGEVLTNTSTVKPSFRGSGLGSLNSSPTGVLQRSTFCSLSNSSSGSSPRAADHSNTKSTNDAADGTASFYDEAHLI